MKEIIYDLIKRMEEEKVAQKVCPTHITMSEINQVIKTSLRRLLDSGEIETGRTINDTYIITVKK